ncbi:HET domain-containing protein [Fusarium sp. LHS14.1]|nr:HET domain-containing protein [Fusarium sp. LHS14.1]
MSKCTLCNNLERKHREHRVAIDFRVSELERSAVGGCQLCSLLHEGISRFSSQIGNLSCIQHVYVWGDSIEKAENLEVDLYFNDARPHMRLLFFVEQNYNSPWTAFKPLPRLQGNTASDDSFTWASRALKDCDANHRECKSLLDTELPTRILDLGDTAKPLQLRLLEPNGEKARYVCLSHCWGKTQQITTNRANLSSRKREILFTSLPKTFQDAVVFTRKLGLRYLWIDSLCIIQDSKPDWIKESAKMASVYQNSFLTLAATKSADSHGGCFSTDSSPRSGYPLSCGEKTIVVYVREEFPHWDDIQGSRLLQEFPLLTRGWAYQERLLAPRVLHFCRGELVLECLRTTVCECCCFKPISLPKVEHFAAIRTIPSLQAEPEEDRQPSLARSAGGSFGRRRRAINTIYSLFGRSSAQPTDPDELSRWRMQYTMEQERARLLDMERHREAATLTVAPLKQKWHEIVRIYSNLTLSVETDRLPAIAGLARQAQWCRTGSYLAGLWEDSLEEDLLWRVSKLVPGSNLRRPAYRAPSWSWASINGGVSYLKGRSRNAGSDFHLRKAVCIPVPGADQFGQIAKGHLEVECTLLRAGIHYVLGSDRNPASIHYKLVMGDRTVTLYADYSLCEEGENQVKEGEEVFCLRVFRDDHSTISLALRQRKSNEYERIGIVEFPVESSKGAPGAFIETTEVFPARESGESNPAIIVLY